MSEEEKKELADELIEKVEKQDLDHVETKETKSEVILKLKCADGGELHDFPVCPDHEVQFEFEEGKDLFCDVDGCSQTMSVPECHGAPMKPFITST